MTEMITVLLHFLLFGIPNRLNGFHIEGPSIPNAGSWALGPPFFCSRKISTELKASNFLSALFASLHGTFRSFRVVHFLLISPVNDIFLLIFCDYSSTVYPTPPILLLYPRMIVILYISINQ